MNGSYVLPPKEIAKIYVAITRARQSVALVVDNDATVSGLTVYWP